MKTFGKHRYPGRLFVVEAMDGSGKSILELERLVERLLVEA
jgi:hypothetical protein